MDIKTGYLYHIKDEDILWFIPLSSKVEKYQKIINQKMEKYGFCNTIYIRKILNEDSAILFQNAFPTLEKYIDHVHTYNGVPVKVGTQLKNEILSNFMSLMKLHKRGHKVFFVDIDKIKGKMLEELNSSDK